MQNITKNALENLSNLSENDLVLVVICGGGSVLFEQPFSMSLEKLIEANQALLRSGATISEMNALSNSSPVFPESPASIESIC